MNNKFKIFAISGSTRKFSSNLALIHCIEKLSAELFEITIYRGISEIPHFNPDLDNESPPVQVKEFRSCIRNSDAVLICTPEYAMGVPGTLKNAIDWTVSSAEFSHKSTALITASSSGKKAHASLLETLKVIECIIPEEIQLLISFIKAKISGEGEIKDAETELLIKRLIQNFYNLLNEQNKQSGI